MNTRTVCRNTINWQLSKFVSGIYGFDPYNTVNARIMTKHIVWSFHGPLGAIAYRSQRAWDFTPGMSSAEKIKLYCVN